MQLISKIHNFKIVLLANLQVSLQIAVLGISTIAAAPISTVNWECFTANIIALSPSCLLHIMSFLKKIWINYEDARLLRYKQLSSNFTYYL